MGWIKRNLIFVVSCMLSLGLLGFGGFLIYQGYSNNSDASDKLNAIYDELQQDAQSALQPGNDHIDNVKKAKEQEQELRDQINKVSSYFSPVPPVPEGEITSKTFATALGATIYQLQQAARESSVGLPAQYNFSFQVQSSMLTISSGLAPLAVQLGEVKAICQVLFAARVNDLEGIQRVRVSDDDVSRGLQSDYTDARPITNDLAVITPYVVTFRGFTPELAKVIAGFANSSGSFIVKSVAVQPVSASTAMTQNNGMNPENPQMNPAAMPQPSPAAGGKGGLQTVLKEQLLRVTMEVDMVKLLPKS